MGPTFHMHYVLFQVFEIMEQSMADKTIFYTFGPLILCGLFYELVGNCSPKTG